MHRWRLLLGLFIAATLRAADAPAPRPVYFKTAFESASVGKIEVLGETEFRLFLKGQQDSRSRNRQTAWFAVRLDNLAGRAVTVRVTGFDGEYNDRPDVSRAGAWYRPVFSEDGDHWTHVAEAAWDAAKKELSFTLPARGDTLWLAHIPLYPHTRALKLIDEIGRLPHARAEVIGHSVLGRPLHLVTVTNFQKPDAAKKIIWLQARQRAWEAGTSFILEGALRFATSADPAAQRLRDENVFLFVPLINPDSVVRGDVRFNAHGWDPNRQWDEVDLRNKLWLGRNPEIWYVKKALIAQHTRQPIALALNLPNTEMNEYLETMVDDEAVQARMQRFFDLAVARSSFDPSRPKMTLSLGSAAGPTNTTNSIWRDARVPMMLLETRVGPGNKLGRRATVDDRLELGRNLIALLAEAAR
jgi:hypothetical protein